MTAVAEPDAGAGAASRCRELGLAPTGPRPAVVRAPPR
jgi:hypothetical protein